MAKTLRDLKRQNEKGSFTGRRDQLDFFRQNISSDSENRSLITNIYGQGGVGKTTLLDNYRIIAEEHGAIVVLLDERISSLLEALSSIATQIHRKDASFKEFLDKYELYQKKKLELDPNSTLLTQEYNRIGHTITRTGMGVIDEIPGGGLINRYLDEEKIAEKTSQFVANVISRVRRPELVKLLLEPESILSPLFVEHLNEASESNQIVLLFDTYEDTASYLDPWFRNVLDDFSIDLQIVIAGRNRLDINTWEDSSAYITTFQLDPFTQDEAITFLHHKGIKTTSAINDILKLSERLPLLVAMLANERPANTKQLDDPSDTAIERFLKWIIDPAKRQLALLAALPRFLNRDIVEVLADDSKLFDWLIDRPFVRKKGKMWVYHDVVRKLILRYIRKESPKRWRKAHKLLAAHYEIERDGINTGDEDKYKNDMWRKFSLEAFYHNSCHDPTNTLDNALNEFLEVWEKNRILGKDWCMVIEQIGNDLEEEEFKKWSAKLAGLVYDYKRGIYDASLDTITTLIERKKASKYSLIACLNYRSRIYAYIRDFDSALADNSRVFELAPEHPDNYASRGYVCYRMRQFNEAISNYNEAIKLNPNDYRAFAHRGYTFAQMQEYDTALNDLNQALTIPSEDGYSWIRALRGDILLRMGQYEEAIEDFNLSLDIAWVVGLKGKALLYLGKSEESIEYLKAVVELFELSTWKKYLYSLALLKSGDVQEAKMQLDRAIDIAASSRDEDPTNFDNAFNLALYYVAHQMHQKAHTLYKNNVEEGASSTFISIAINDLYEYLKLFPDNQEAHRAIDYLESHLGD